MTSKYIVINNDILGWIIPGLINTIQITASKRMGVHDGLFPFSDDSTRLATLADFEYFRVHPPKNFV